MPSAAQNKKTLEYATDVRKFEIGLFWTRSLFFWGFTTTALAAYGASIKYGTAELQFGSACFGLISGIAWTLVNRSSKYWQKVWEVKVERSQNAAIGQDLFSVRSNPVVAQNWTGGPKHYSVSKLAIALSDFVVLCWLGALVRSSPFAPMIDRIWVIPIIFFFTVAFVFRMICCCKPDPRN